MSMKRTAKTLLEQMQSSEIVDEFYQRQVEDEEISLLIGDASTLNRLSNAQRKYIIDLFSGTYDSEYVNNRLRISMVHKHIGVEPKLYLKLWSVGDRPQSVYRWRGPDLKSRSKYV